MTRPVQRGFAVMLAIFLVVTLAAVGAYLVTVSTGQVEAVVQDEQGARAYQAARAGVDWAAHRVLRHPGTGFASSCTGAPFTQRLTLTQGLAGFYADVTCEQVASESEGGVVVAVLKLDVTACNTSPACCAAGAACGPTYVERKLQLILTR